MFKLQRLEITGFKSFADYTEIVFTGEGITAVVGPNGCGKSNVSDCIAWVLGEQKAKSLRGEDMKDVIFQGSGRRKPSGMAEVVLHLVRDESPIEQDELQDIDEELAQFDENAISIEEIEGEAEVIEIPLEMPLEVAEVSSNGTAAAMARVKSKRHWRPKNRAFDFAVGEAVSITRRLYLSGESEYQLNGKSCRLRDIHDLFSGTGLSGTNYALIEQGRIGQILSAKPSDRRTLIEEAAGISKFRTRQRAAESRLESAKSNLRRISDIVSEIEKQENSLRRQAAKTRKYKVLRDELRELLKNVFVAEGSRLANLVEQLDVQMVTAVSLEQKFSAELIAKEELFRDSTQKSRIAEEDLTKIRAAHAENLLNRDRTQREKVYQEEQIVDLHNRNESLNEEIKSTKNRIEAIAEESKRLKSEDLAQRQVSEKEELTLRVAEQSYQDKQRAVKEIEAELEKIRNQVFQHTSAVERFADIKRQHEDNLERLTQRFEGLKLEGIRAEKTYAENVKSVDEIRKQIAESIEKLEEHQAEKKEFVDLVNEARQKQTESSKALKEVSENFSRTKHRLETLQELEEKRAIYAPAVQKLFSEQEKIGVKFDGILADKLNVDSRIEKAVELIFGNDLQAVLVKNAAEAKKVSAWLKENNVGRISILAKEGGSKQSSPAKSSHPMFLDLLGVSADYRDALISGFPREMSSQVVESLNDISTQSGENFVTFDGDFCFGGNYFVSGKHNTNEKNTSLLAFKRELRELEATSKNLTKDLGIAEARVEEDRKLFTEREEKVFDTQQIIAFRERELLSFELNAKSLIQDAERNERHKKVVAADSEQIQKEIADLKLRHTQANENAEVAEKARLIAADKQIEITDDLTVARQKIESENMTLSEKRVLAAAAAERRRSVASALRRVENELSDLEGRIVQQSLEKNEIESKLLTLNSSIKELVGKIETVEEEKLREANELSKATEHLNFSRTQADAISVELTELNKSAADARNTRAAMEVQQAETVTRLQSLKENCFNELNVSLHELIETTEIAEDFELEESRITVDDLREKLENFGAINMLALEELAETEERLLFLTSQRKDIVDSIGTAEEALREIKRRSRERFREAFEAINFHFIEFFQELFGGGKGEMNLLESEDILEAGIEIVAQPPGKRLQNILLLSGGEKAMTAIALVMAIFQYRPSPFCLLDEVDAPLDEANVGRFVKKIEQMSTNTQFIVITHNKRTMEAAKALYGVTMEEPGVSKVVSVRFE
jgi:chromosome segregation protein